MGVYRRCVQKKESCIKDSLNDMNQETLIIQYTSSKFFNEDVKRRLSKLSKDVSIHGRRMKFDCCKFWVMKFDCCKFWVSYNLE